MGKIKEAIKYCAGEFVRDKNYRNECIVNGLKSALIGYGIGAIIVDVNKKK